MSRTLTEQLRAVTLFRGLKPEDAERVAAVASVVSYHRGEFIFREGDPAEWFFVITRGRVKVYKTAVTGKDVILEIFGTGDPLGAVAVYEERPLPASAVALEDTTCVRMGRGLFFDLLERYPSLVRGLLLGLTHRLVELTARVADLTGGRVEPRVARLFLKMGQDLGRPERDGLFVPLALSRQELADLTGTTIETAIRIMSRWGKDGIVRTEKDGFIILDQQALEALALS